MDSVSILGAVDSFIQVQDSGTYWVVYTSIDGCIASSEQANIEINENPTSPVFVNENNLLTLFSPGALPDNFALQWYLNGELIDGATEAEYCIPESGTYMLVVTDLDSECSNFYDLSINYNPDFENCVSATDEFFGLAEELRLYPNPTAELAIVNFRLLESGNVSWALENAIGQTLIRELDRFGAGEVTLELNLGDYPAGLYLIKLGLRDKIKTLKLIKL